MAAPNRSLSFTATLCVLMFGFAFVAAPKSCEWGLTAYTCVGLAALAAFLVAPFVLEAARPVKLRVGLALGYFVLGLVVWIAGLFAANVRIMCRLF